MITLLVMTDGRQHYLQRTLESFNAMVTGTITRKVIHDDSGLVGYRKFLQGEYGDWDFDLVGGPERVGYSSAVQRAWQYLEGDTNRFTFHLEDDFEFNRPVNLDEIAEFLDERWWLAQMGLRRERWGREERGFVEDMPSAYAEREALHHMQGTKWLEHRLYYTMTPHLYRSRLRQRGWPDGPGSEVTFKDKLLAEGLPWNVPGEHVRFGFWGGIEDGANAVKHIGEERAGFGY